jgi:RecB family exonuclease
MAPVLRAITTLPQIKRYEQCPRSFDLHERRNVPAEDDESARFARALHAACTATVREHVEARRTGPVSPERGTAHFEWAFAEEKLRGLAPFQEGTAIVRDFVADLGSLAAEGVLAVATHHELSIGDRTLRVAIDRVDKLDDETVEVFAYKGGGHFYSRDDLEADVALPLYAACAKALYPWAKRIQVTYWMLRHRVRIPVACTEAEVATALCYLESLVNRMASSAVHLPTVGAHCVRCPSRRQCDDYAATLATERPELGDAPDSLEAVAKEREHVAGLVRIFEGRKRELEGVLRTRLQDEDELRAGGMRYRLVPTRSPAEYPLRHTVEALTEAASLGRDAVLDRIGTVDGAALKALLDDLGQRVSKARLKVLRDDLEAHAHRTVIPRFTATALRRHEGEAQ